MSGYFITATGTDLGKTLVTAGLCWQLRQKKHEVQCLKPIMTGVTAQNWQQSDAAVLMGAMEKKPTATSLKEVSPWRFEPPISPHLAAKKAKVDLDMEEIGAFCEAPMNENSVTLIEGTGGVMSPINERFTMLDLMIGLDLPVILITGSYVGALSHALTTISVLRANGVEIHAIIVNESKDSATSPQETADAIAHFSGLNTRIKILPYVGAGDQKWKDIPDLTELVNL